MEHYFQEIHGWFDYYNVFGAAVNQFPEDSVFVELGCWKGMSSSYLAVEAKNSGKFLKLHFCDTWSGSPEHLTPGSSCYEPDLVEDPDFIYKEFVKNIERSEYPYNIHRMSSLELASFFNDNSVDFIYFDTDHSYEHVAKELKLWYPKVKKGGILSGHDYSGDVEKAVLEFFTEDVNKVFGHFSYSWVVEKQFDRSMVF